MSEELHYTHTNDSDYLYAVIRKISGQVWNDASSQWDIWPGAGQSLDNYDIGKAQASGNLWNTNWPSGISSSDWYIIQIRSMPGDDTPNADDAIVASAKGFWDGSLFADRDLTLIEKASKAISNKAVQDKVSGKIDYYDNDGTTIILTHTPTDGASDITRMPS
jgi:hypothetical protein